QAQDNLEIVHQVLHDVLRQGISEEELQQAKSKIGSRVVRGSERPMGRMQALGMDWTNLGQYRTVDEELRAFDAVTLKDVQAVLEQYPLTRSTTLALGPLNQLKKPNGNGKV